MDPNVEAVMNGFSQRTRVLMKNGEAQPLPKSAAQYLVLWNQKEQLNAAKKSLADQMKVLEPEVGPFMAQVQGQKFGLENMTDAERAVFGCTGAFKYVRRRRRNDTCSRKFLLQAVHNHTMQTQPNATPQKAAEYARELVDFVWTSMGEEWEEKLERTKPRVRPPRPGTAADLLGGVGGMVVDGGLGGLGGGGGGAGG